MRPSAPAIDARHQRRVALQGFLAGFLGCLLLFVLAKAGKVYEYDPGRWPKVAIFLIAFIGAGFVIGAVARRASDAHAARLSAVGFGASLLGIAASSIFWMLVEEHLFSRLGASPIYEERVLFPIEIAILWFFGSLPIILGIVAGLYLTSGGSASVPSREE